MSIDQSLQSYLDELASANSTPGGGSAAALSGAMGAALASMVARLTVGKANYADVQSAIQELLQQTEQLRERFQELMQEDKEVYGRLSACFKLPRNTDEEQATRTQAIQARLGDAARVPLEVVECAASLMQCCRRIAEIGNTSVLSDVATGAMLASSGGSGAAWMVRVNLQAMKDQELVSTLNIRLSAALNELSEGSVQVTSVVGERTR